MPRLSELSVSQIAALLSRDTLSRRYRAATDTVEDEGNPKEKSKSFGRMAVARKRIKGGD